MALWNDKRTPQGVVTNSSNGRSGTLPTSIPADRSPAPRSAQRVSEVSQTLTRSPAVRPPVSQAVAAVRQTRVAPRGATPIGKVPVDRPSNASAAAGVRQDKRSVKGSAASGKPAPRPRA